LHKLFSNKYCPRCEKVRSVRKVKVYTSSHGLNSKIKIYSHTNNLCSICNLDLDKLN